MKQKFILASSVLTLILLTALFLLRLQAGRVMANPGLKLIAREIHDETGGVVGTNTVDLPEHVLDYESKPWPITRVELKGLPRDTTFARRAYIGPDRTGLILSVVMMGTDRGSIHKPEICLSGQGWTQNRSEFLFIPVNLPQPYQLPVKRILASKEIVSAAGARRTWRSIYIYWFVAENQITARHGERMWSMASELIRTGTLQRWAYVACWANCLPGQEEETQQRMERFISAAVPEFQLATGKSALSSAPSPSAR